MEQVQYHFLIEAIDALLQLHNPGDFITGGPIGIPIFK